MISWLMLLTFLILTVMPFFLASGTSTLFKPSMTGWSTLVQIVTVLLSAATAAAARSERGRGGDGAHREKRGPGSPWVSHHLLLGGSFSFLDTCAIAELV